ncbi:Clp protease, partial [Leptospira interrogans serovar Pomona]|nr:Clp protease [Leptospira interrogans serovar Pomona]
MILTEEMERTLKKAWEEAKRRRNEFITLEHILFALTYDTVGKEVL